MRLIRGSRDCKQRSLPVSKQAPTVSKKASLNLRFRQQPFPADGMVELGTFQQGVSKQRVNAFCVATGITNRQGKILYTELLKSWPTLGQLLANSPPHGKLQGSSLQ